jgi:hypothetical protein
MKVRGWWVVGLVCVLEAGLMGAVPGNRAQVRAAGRAGTLERWLGGHALIRDRIAWVTGDGTREDFVSWSPEMKGRIEEFYAKQQAGDKNLGMKLPDPEKANGYYPADVAFDIYAAHVAHVIYVEANGLVPWKLEDHPVDEIDQLLCSTAYFSMIRPSTRSLPAGIAAMHDLQDVPEVDGLGEYISDPRIGYEFLSGKTSTSGRSLIGKDELETLKNLTIWLRDNVDHGEIDNNVGERAKKLRWLDERLRPYAGQRTAMANVGCHSATKLMVDLARSINMPLLNVRALDDSLGGQKIHFLSRTHGSLVCGWAGEHPRIVWHTDNIYAREGRICFPVDEKTGKLLPKAEADQRYFDAVWKTPQEWTAAGFIYKLERVFPGKGFGHDSAAPDEDRDELGMMSGYWRGMGQAHLDEMLDWSQDYTLCGAPLLELAANQIVSAQLDIDFKQYRANLRENELPRMPTMAEYEARAATGLKAVGGAARYQRLKKETEDRRGADLLKPGVTYDGRRR